MASGSAISMIPLQLLLVLLVGLMACNGQTPPSHAPPPGNYSFVGGALVQTLFSDAMAISVGVAYQLQVTATPDPSVQQWTMVVVSVNPDGKKTLITDSPTTNFKSNIIMGANDSYTGRLHYGDSIGSQSAYSTHYYPDPTQLMITYAGSDQTSGVDVWKGSLYKTWTSLNLGGVQIESLWTLTQVTDDVFSAFAQGAKPLPTAQGTTHWYTFMSQMMKFA